MINKQFLINHLVSFVLRQLKLNNRIIYDINDHLCIIMQWEDYSTPKGYITRCVQCTLYMISYTTRTKTCIEKKKIEKDRVRGNVEQIGNTK